MMAKGSVQTIKRISRRLIESAGVKQSRASLRIEVLKCRKQIVITSHDKTYQIGLETKTNWYVYHDGYTISLHYADKEHAVSCMEHVRILNEVKNLILKT